MNEIAPVLFLVFNRPEHTRKSLARIREIQPSRLYVHCDGPRPDRPGESELVDEVRKVLETVDWPCTVKTLYRESNHGLRKGVYAAISWFFEQEESGIVLEDDCVPDPSFFRFCTELLAFYREDESVMHISGSNLAEAYTANASVSYFYSKFSFVWGWAGWRRSWAHMLIDLDGLEEFIASGMVQKWLPNRAAQVYLVDKFRSTRDGAINSWAYAWFYSILKHEGWCIVPRVNLVENVGIGAPGATNTTEFNRAKQLRAHAIRFPLKHPREKKVNPERAMAFFYTTQKSRLRLRLWRVLNLLGLR